MRWDVQTAARFLSRMGQVVEGHPHMKVHVKRSPVGIKQWGAIDYLVNEHNYRLMKQVR